MELAAPTVADFDELLHYLPVLYGDGFKPVLRWDGGTKGEDGAFTVGWPVYEDAVESFFSAAARDCWADYEYAGKYVWEIIHDPERVASASLQDVKSMLTWCVRGERFCDGHWEGVIEDNFVRHLLLRLQALRPG